MELCFNCTMFQMKMNNNKNIIFELREKAEEILRNSNKDEHKDFQEEDFKKLLHELEVHQIELELQNRNLLETTQALEVSQAKYFDLFDKAPIGYLTINDVSKIIELNLKFSQMIHDDKVNLIGKSLSSFIHPDYQDDFYFHLQKVFREEKQSSIELKIINKIGKIKTIVLESKPLIKENHVTLIHCAIIDITERKEIENRLKFEKDSLEAIYKISPVAIFTIDNNFNISSWNNRIEQITEYSQKDVLSKNLNLIFDPEFNNVVKVIRSLEFELADEKPIEAKVITKSGIQKITIINIHKYEEVGFLISIKDISEKVKNDIIIIESENRFRAIVEKTPVGLCITDENGFFEYVNKAYCRIYKYSPEELIGKHFTTVVKEEFKEILIDLHNRFIEGTAENRGEWNVIDKYNNDLFILADAARIIGDDNKYRKVTFVVDITQSKKNNLISKGLNDILEQIISGADLNIVMQNFITLVENIADNMICTIKFINPDNFITEDVFVRKAGEKYRKIFYNRLFDENSGAFSRAFLNRSLIKIEKPTELDFFRGYHNSFFEVEIDGFWVMPIIVNTGEARGLVNFYFQDYPVEINNFESLIITISHICSLALEMNKSKENLVYAKEKAEVANKIKSQFLANMSHEIRTPMNAILGFAELLKFQDFSEEKFQEYVNGILLGGKNLLNLINDILDLSKIEAGKVEIKTSPVNLHVLLEEISQIFSVKVQRQSLNYFMNINKDVPKIINSDEIRLRQILFNLIGNAVKFTESGTIRIDVSASNFSTINKTVDLIFCVEDTGIGIPKNNLENIFESFSQVENKMSSKYEGTGLGLSITKRLVEMMNGKITVESEIDKGSKFIVKLKSVDINTRLEIGIDDDLIDTNSVKFINTKLIIVTKSKVDREIYSGFLTPHGIKVKFEDSCDNILDVMKEFNPKLIFMDVQLPVKDTVTQISELKHTNHCKLTPLIAIFSSDDYNEEKEIEQIADSLLKKPVSKHQLLSEIIKYLPHHTIKKSQKIEAFDYSDKNNYSLDKYNQDIINVLNADILDSWNIAKRTMIIDHLKLFSSKLLIFSKDNELKEFEIYAKELAEHLNSFNIERIIRILPIYEKMIEIVSNNK